MTVAAGFACLLVLVAFATPNVEAIQCYTCGNAGEFMCPQNLADATVTTSNTAATHCYLKYDVETMSYRMGVVVTQADCSSTTEAINCCNTEKCNNNLALLTQTILEKVMKECYSCGLPGLCSDTATGNPLSKNKCFMCSASIVNGTNMLGCESTCIDSAEPPYKKCCAASTGTNTFCNNEYVTDAKQITLSCYDCGDSKSVAATCPSPFSPFKVAIVKSCKACKAVKTSATENSFVLSCVKDPSADSDCKNQKCCYSSFCNRIYPTDSPKSVTNGISYTPIRTSYLWAFPTLIIGLGLHLVSMN